MWGHFECDGGALPLCGVNSWPGVPLPSTTLDYWCPQVSPDCMNIFLNFANLIPLSLIIISLVQGESRGVITMDSREFRNLF